MSNLFRNKLLARTLIVVFSLALVFSGCSRQEEASADKPAQNDPAADYPDQNITVMVGHKEGGSTDIILRTLQPYFQEAIGGTVVVENVEGGGGNKALSTLYRADPDGYTLMLSPFPSAILGELVKDGEFKVKEFTFLHGVTGSDYNSIFVKYDSPYKDLNELVAAAKAQTITLSGSGVGTNSDMALRLLEKDAGVTFEYVSFDSGTEAAVAVAGGHTVAGIGNIVSLKQLQDEKKIRVLAVFGPERHSNFPDIPAAPELGYKNSVMEVCVGMVAPPNTPPEIAQKLADALDVAVNDPEFQKQAADLGSNVTSTKPDEFKNVVMQIYEQADAIKDTMKAAAMQ